VGSDEGHMFDAGLSQEVFFVPPASVSASRSLNSVRTYVRFVCEGGHRTPANRGMAGSAPCNLGRSRSRLEGHLVNKLLHLSLKLK
jgi:hypothetical protein